MTQVSRKPLHKDVFFKIRDDFTWVLAALHTQGEVRAFFEDFFTKTERIMFAKRLAVAMMLIRGFSYDIIGQVLHVSSATVSRVADWLDHGGVGVKRAIEKLNKEEKAQEFWNKVNRFIDTTLVHPYKMKNI